jgi:hypothetical protein
MCLGLLAHEFLTERERAVERLEESEKRYRAIIEQTMDLRLPGKRGYQVPHRIQYRVPADTRLHSRGAVRDAHLRLHRPRGGRHRRCLPEHSEFWRHETFK